MPYLVQFSDSYFISFYFNRSVQCSGSKDAGKLGSFPKEIVI